MKGFNIYFDALNLAKAVNFLNSSSFIFQLEHEVFEAFLTNFRILKLLKGGGNYDEKLVSNLIGQVSCRSRSKSNPHIGSFVKYKQTEIRTNFHILKKIRCSKLRYNLKVKKILKNI